MPAGRGVAVSTLDASTLLAGGRLRASRRTCSRVALPVALLVFVVVFIR